MSSITKPPATNRQIKESQTPKLTQRAYLNAVAAFIDFGAKIAVSLVVTPILVSGLGSVLFGVWQILGRLVSYMSAADGRPTQALKWVMANHQATDDIQIKRRAVGSALGVWLLMLPVLILLGAGLVWLAPSFTNAPDEIVTMVQIACILLVLNLIVSSLVLIPEAVLRGMNLGYKRMGLVAGLNVLGGALTVAAIYLGWGLVGIAAAQVVITIVTGVLFWYLVRVFVPWFGLARASFAEVRNFLKLSIWYAGWNLVNKLLTASDVIILGFLLTASSVTTYVLTGYVAQTLLTVVTIIIGAILPGLGKLVQRKDYSRVIELRHEMLLISSLLAGTTGSMILLWNHSFVSLWVGAEHYAGDVVNLLLVLIAVQFLFIRNDTYFIDLTLDLKHKVLIGAFSAFVTIGLASLLIPESGIIGLCISVLAGRTILIILYPRIISTFLETTPSTQAKILSRPLFVMGILFASTFLLGQYIRAITWLALILSVALSFIAIFIIQFLAGFSREYRERLLKRMIRLSPLTLDA